MEKVRLDLLITARGIAPSRARAQEMIRSGTVQVAGTVLDKPSAAVSEDAEITVVGDFCPYVSRGGLKLEKALRQFFVDPTGLICCDCGASTGGFTDCLLQNGAKKVYSIDVGTDQLSPQLRKDPRVVVMEKTNVRNLSYGDLPDEIDLTVVDVSFISLRNILPAVYTLLREGGSVLCLIKPQFEAGRGNVGKKGVVKDRKIHRLVLDEFLLYTAEIGYSVKNLTFSPVTGPEGNIEFLAHLTKSPLPGNRPDTMAIVDAAHSTLKG